MKFQPLQQGRRPGTFSHQAWLIEIKLDGFRALLTSSAEMQARHGMATSSSLRTLCESLATELTRSVSLDGEIVCLGDDGKSRFYDLLFRTR